MRKNYQTLDKVATVETAVNQSRFIANDCSVIDEIQTVQYGTVTMVNQGGQQDVRL